MEKRWHKISDLVEAQILTKVEAVSRALGGRIPIYTPEGKLLMPIEISLKTQDRPKKFLCERFFNGNKIVRNKLYNIYDDIKFCLLRDCDIEAYISDEWSFQVETRKLDDPCIIELAEKILKIDKHDELGLPIDIDPYLQADDKIPTAKTLGALYSFILALAHEKNINLAESGLQKNLVLTANDLGLPLSKGFVSETIKELAEYENAHKG